MRSFFKLCSVHKQNQATKKQKKENAKPN